VLFVNVAAYCELILGQEDNRSAPSEAIAKISHSVFPNDFQTIPDLKSLKTHRPDLSGFKFNTAYRSRSKKNNKKAVDLNSNNNKNFGVPELPPGVDHAAVDLDEYDNPNTLRQMVRDLQAQLLAEQKTAAAP
jgi:hypothetical protein